MRKIFLFCMFLLCNGLLLEAQKDQLTGKAKKEATLYTEDADFLFSEGNYYAALPLYLKLIKLDSTEEYYRFQAGICYIYTDEKEKSIDYLERVYDEDPDLKDITYYLGRAYHINYRFDTAITLFKKYLTKGPTEELRKSALNYISYCKNAKVFVAHPEKVEITNLGPVINTGASEYAPVITADESEIIYTYRGPQSTGGLMNARMKPDTNGEYYEDVFISHKLGDNWLPPQGISEINTKANDASIALSTDGQTLFTFKSSLQDGGDIFVSTLNGNKWSKPERLGPTINTPFWEGSCSLSSDGKTLFFASERPGGFGGRDIYMSSKQPNGSWGTARNLGKNINTTLDEDAPFMHPDGVTLFFSSEGWNSMGASDIFYSTLNLSDSTWSKPINLGYPINSPGDDRYYVLNADGTRGYFSSNRKGGFGQQDLYSVTPGVRGPKPILALTIGIVSNDEKPTDADIQVSDRITNKVEANYHSNSETGKYVIALTPGNKYKIAVQTGGANAHIEYLDVDSLATFVKVQEDIHLYTPEYRKANNITVSDTSTVLQHNIDQQVAEYKSNQRIDVYETKVYQRILNDYGTVDSNGITYNVELGSYANPASFDSTKFRGMGQIQSKTDAYGNTLFYVSGIHTMLDAEILKDKVITSDTSLKKTVKVTVDNNGKRELVSQFYINEFRKDKENFLPDTVEKAPVAPIVSLNTQDRTQGQGNGEIDTNKIQKDYGTVKVDGLSYKLELGSYTDTTQFKLGYLNKYGPISKETMADGSTHYYIGNFQSLSEAQKFKSTIGQKDSAAANALVMVFYFTDKPKPVKEFFAPPCDPGPPQDFSAFADKDLNDPAIYAKLIETAGNICIDGLIFRVQIGAYRHPENYHYRNLLSFVPPLPIVKKYDDGITRFTMGEFKSIKLAEIFRQRIIGRGTKDAWVTAEYNGKRMLLQELIKTNFYTHPIN
ncbi:MAG TPA: hypothetical protein VK783_09595 [Bacteroidia bacterium]|nr:hypothetical protein [Bacteroidia bacterium]